MQSVRKSLLVCCTLPVAAWAADEPPQCMEARKAAEKFLALEAQGKRLYANSEYFSVMTYTADDGTEGDEPGWDSVHIVAASSPATILGCGTAGDALAIKVRYVKIGEINGWNPEPNACYYDPPQQSAETLVLKKIGGSYKVDGLNAYEPYASLEVINAQDDPAVPGGPMPLPLSKLHDKKCQ